ncbi:hypothetical protein JSQ81_11285 [Sporosarcina sp. Marseille-Q4063]|uniref:DUF6688 domain-containing protein n=1 Tax=Sporosarcina sp. Marseille-Q4063 TaxID=2810514 RepID=UPI001BB02E52|nr:DUF6688 family protein [Sporosarcina sp. Marseille-Q4063]QUW20445.1 hypothetical protein JSQ81_11285 [Sporosarcina sp. Marseille-Q4063]
MYADRLFSILILMLFSALPIYSFLKMIQSFRNEKTTSNEDVIAKGNLFETFILLGIFTFILLGFFFNIHGLPGGDPLRVYELTGMPLEGYAPLSSDLFTVFVFFILGWIAYWLLSDGMGKLSPILYVVSSSLLLVNILFTLVYFTHTGFSHYGDSISVGASVFFLQYGYGSLSFLYIAKLNDSLREFLIDQREKSYSNRFLRFLSQISLNYERIPVAGMLFLLPVFVLVQLILVLLGQRPDSFIQVFLDTSSYTYSKIPAPPPEIVPGDGHYLCTVSAVGHKRLVKPLRSGIRNGERIVVNRQLLIANAFENILEEYTPNLHKRIRHFYDTYGYPVSRHIKTKRSADIVYLLMKPLEWFFLLVLYTIDAKPENRIHMQYSELRVVHIPK